MTNGIRASDAEQCSLLSHEVRQLAGRLASCSDRADALLARFWQVQMSQWQSPAGAAYRNSVGLQAAALRRARERLDMGAAAVQRHAQGMASKEFRSVGAGS